MIIKLFEEFVYKDVKIKSSKFLFDEGYDIDYEIYCGKDYIGKCEVAANFLKDGFDDTKDNLFFAKRKFDWENPVKKDYYNKFPYIIQIHGFEIEEEYQRRGLGLISFKKILESIKRQFPNHNGIYLSVFANNTPAVKIYQKMGFKTCKVEDDILVMKFNIKK